MKNMYFQTEIETETWVCEKDVPWATYYGNICFHAVRQIQTKL